MGRAHGHQIFCFSACSSNCLENYNILGIKYQVQNFALIWFYLKLGIFNKPGFAVVRDLLSLQMAKFYCKSCNLLGRESQHPRAGIHKRSQV